MDINLSLQENINNNNLNQKQVFCWNDSTWSGFLSHNFKLAHCKHSENNLIILKKTHLHQRYDEWIMSYFINDFPAGAQIEKTLGDGKFNISYETVPMKTVK